MTEDGEDRTPPTAPPPEAAGAARAAREARSGAALRQNLARRKAQARALRAPSLDAPGAPHDDKDS